MMLHGEIRLAQPTDSQTLALIEKKYESLLGGPVSLAPVQDPSLLAGFVVVLDGKVFDCSALGQLEGIKTYLKHG